jgi:hypothetical protein
LFEIDFGAKNVRSFLLPVARMRQIFLSPIRRFPQKNFGSWRKRAQLNRTSSKRSHDEPSQERTMRPPHSFFCCGREEFRVHPEFRLAGESNSCFSLLARSVPPCGPEVEDAQGLYFVRELIANMATIPKPVVPACDWRENDPLLTPQQVAERLNTSLDWVWDHSSRKMPLLPVIRSGDGPGRAAILRYRARIIEFRQFLDSQVPIEQGA